MDSIEQYKKSDNPRKDWIQIINESNFDDFYFEEILTIVFSRFGKNLEIIISHLEELGYIFTGSKVSPSNIDAKNKLVSLISDYGDLPKSFNIFLDCYGGIDLTGHFPQWKANNNIPHLDPLVITPIEKIADYAEWWLKSNPALFTDDSGKYYVWFSPDQFTKDKVSGGSGYGIEINREIKMDSTVTNFGIKIGFVDYLRLCCKWCGLPNLHWFQKDLENDKLFQKIISIQDKIIRF